MKDTLPKAFLPNSAPLSVWRMRGFLGLDRRGGERAGYLSVSRGVDAAALPALHSAPVPARTAHAPIPGRPLSLHAIEGVLYATAEIDGAAHFLRYLAGAWQSVPLPNADAGVRRTVIPFTYYNDPSNPLDTDHNFKMVLIFPDGVFIRPDRETLTLYKTYMRTDGALPTLTHACVYLSRVFGVGGECAYASDHNCVSHWEYDTADKISASHAWVTSSQTNTDNAGNFTAIHPFGGSLLAFKEECCQAIGGKSNPFRLSDLFSVGCTDPRAIAEVGDLLFFCSRDKVYAFDGDSLREVGAPLHLSSLAGAQAGAAGGLLYLLVPNEGIFTYSPATGAWSELHPFGEREITLLCTGRDECLFVDGDGAVYSTKEGVARPFEVCTTPFVPELSAPFRLVRLRLTMTAAPAASLEILCRNSRGEEVSVAVLTGDGRTRRESVRIPIGADTATTLCLRGQGEITVTAMETVVAMTATDGA